jgi:membrane associated rhomboid family serine protease
MIPLRDENPSHSFPFFTILLIITNITAFVYEFSFGEATDQFIMNFGAIPLEYSKGLNLPDSSAISPYLSLITSMFLHGGIGHILGNMWFLWIFGDNLEDTLGKFRFIIFYFVCGLAASLTHIFLNPSSDIPCIGASGAISGVLGGYVVLFPLIRIKTLVTFLFFWTTIYVPALFFLGLWFVMQLMGQTSSGTGGGIAFAAHIGGFVAGALWMLCLSKKPRSAHVYRYSARRVPRW